MPPNIAKLPSFIVPLGSSFYARNVAPALPDFDISSGDSEQFGDNDGLLISSTSEDKRPAGDAIAILQFVKSYIPAFVSEGRHEKVSKSVKRSKAPADDPKLIDRV